MITSLHHMLGKSRDHFPEVYHNFHKRVRREELIGFLSQVGLDDLPEFLGQQASLG